ncbi:MAG: hypothetical protein ACOYN0_05150 [Phycisphaerales bacterium]
MNLDFSMLMTPAGGAAVLAALTLVVLIVAHIRSSLVVLGIMLFVGSLAIPAEAAKDVGSTMTWLTPLQMQRSLVYLFCGALLTLCVGLHFGKIRVNSFSGTGILLMVVAGYAGLIQCFHLGLVEGMLTVASAVLTIGSLSLLLPSLINTWEDLCMLLRVIVFTSVAYAIAVVIQLGINRTPLVAPNAFRFQGISGNPQFVAVLLAVATTTTVFLILNDEHKRYKTLYFALTCMNVVLLGWTGSRTGTLMTIIGLTSVLYTRMGKTILFAPFIVGGAAVIFQLMESAGINLGLDRLTSTSDTRSAVWVALVENALQNPILGAGTRGAGAAENSFLLATASFGFGSLFTLLLLLLGVAVQCCRLLMIRGRVDAHAKRAGDLQIGFFAMYFAGSMFEGYIIARISVMLPLFMIFSAITSRLLEFEAASRASGGYGAQDHDSAGVFTEAPEHAS